MPYKRTDRVNALLQRELGTLISEELSDPRIRFTTVTAVQTSPDLRTAKVFVSVLGDEAAIQETMSGLVAAKAHLRHELGERVELRYIPELVFVSDTSAARSIRIDTLLRERQDE